MSSLFGNDLQQDNPYITIYTSKRGKLNKTIKANGEKISNALLYNGQFETVQINSLLDLKKIISKLRPNQAIGLGVHKSLKKGIVTSSNIDTEKARSKDNFKWNEGKNIALLDYDYFKGITECNDPSSFLNLLCEIDSVFKTAEMLVVPSSSSNIYKENELFLDSKGLHCYVIIDGDINTFRDKLWASCWAKGFGTTKIAKDGTILTRTIFDKAVFSPERLIFEAAPTLENGLLQPKKDYFHIRGLSINPNNLETHTEAAAIKEKKAKEQISEYANEIKNKYIISETDKLVKKGYKKEDAESIVNARVGDHGTIYSNDYITLKNGDTLKASDLNVSHNGEYCLDPIEPENAPAVINVSEDGTFKSIYSFLHGGRFIEIIEPNDDIQLEISKEAKELAQAYKEELWVNTYGFTYNQKLLENWEIKFQSYLNACLPTFIEKMSLLGTSAGNGKTTTLGFFILKKIIPNLSMSVLVVVNTIRNARELQHVINDLIPEGSETKAVVLHSSDSKTLDADGNPEKSDIKEDEARNHRVLIITHAKLQQSTIKDNTKSIRYIFNSKNELVERDLTVVDEAIDFAETASVQLLHIKLCITYLEHILQYKKSQSAEKFKKILIKIRDRKIEQTNETLEPSQLFGKENLNIKVDEDVIESLEQRKQTEFNIRKFINDLETLSRADAFVMDAGGLEGIVYSSSKDRLPSGKGIVILDASATINVEYKHYITRKEAERVRINQDARSYKAVTIHTAITRDKVGKVEIKDNDESKLAVLKKENLLVNEVFSKTTNDDKTLIIGNMDFMKYLRNNSFGGRDVKCEWWNNLTGRNDLRDRNKVFICTLPFKNVLHKLNLAHKHGLYGDEHQTAMLQYSNIADDIYQAIMRANLRKTQKNTTDAPKCDIFIVLPAKGAKLRNLVINKLKALLVDCKWVDWDLKDMNGEKLFNTNPPYQPSETLKGILNALTTWDKHNPKTLYANLSDLAPIADLKDNTMRQGLMRKIGLAGEREYYGSNWIEDMSNGFTYVKASDSKAYLKDLGVDIKGRGKCMFIRNSFD